MALGRLGRIMGMLFSHFLSFPVGSMHQHWVELLARFANCFTNSACLASRDSLYHVVTR